MEQNPEEIKFAHRRKLLQLEVSPALIKVPKECGLLLHEGGGDLTSPEGYLRTDTLKGQILSYFATVDSPIGTKETVEVLIGHGAEWAPIAMVFSTREDHPIQIDYAGDQAEWNEKVVQAIKAKFKQISQLN